MKQFAVFAGYQYYPSGGMADFQKSFDTCEEANEYAKGLENGQIGAYGWTTVEDMSRYE